MTSRKDPGQKWGARSAGVYRKKRRREASLGGMPVSLDEIRRWRSRA
ncbi:MAG: hypothetical protein WAN74_07790 [Thermoplasmata archaeon]